MQALTELRTVGQCGERVFEGQSADLAFAALDGLAHGLEGLREFADFIALVTLNGVAIVALFDAAHRLGEAAQRGGDALRGVEAADGKDEHPQAGQGEQGELQTLVGSQGAVNGAHQHGGDGGLAGEGVEHHRAGAEFVASQME